MSADKLCLNVQDGSLARSRTAPEEHHAMHARVGGYFVAEPFLQKVDQRLPISHSLVEKLQPSFRLGRFRIVRDRQRGASEELWRRRVKLARCDVEQSI